MPLILCQIIAWTSAYVHIGTGSNRTVLTIVQPVLLILYKKNKYIINNLPQVSTEKNFAELQIHSFLQYPPGKFSKYQTS